MSSSLPLLFLFGGRGNIFIILTGWSYRTFNVFHRWIARFLLLQAIVHGCVFSAFEVNGESLLPRSSSLAQPLCILEGG